MLNTSPQDIEVLQQVKVIYQGYKKSLNFIMSDELTSAIREMHKRIYGVAIPNCSRGTCIIKACYTLLIESGVGI